MHSTLYLDTARFGRMRIRARQAAMDHARLCADEGGSRRVEELLVGGYESWPRALRLRYPWLADWGGVDWLRQSLRNFVGADDSTAVLLASRTATLMRIAARALARRCRSILHTDLEWDSYVALIREEASRSACKVRSIRVRALVREWRIDAEDLAELIADECLRGGCDGLFLSDISHDGVRVPVAAIRRRLECVAPPMYVVVDGSQAIGQAPIDLTSCDVYLGGAQKWLRAGHTLGIALIPRGGAPGPFSAHHLGTMIPSPADPLLDLARQLDGEGTHPYGETADLGGLFCLTAALRASLAETTSFEDRFRYRLANAARVSAVAAGSGWESLRPRPGLRSGIVLIRPTERSLRSVSPGVVRLLFHRQGLAVTAYDGGQVRLSMAGELWEEEDLGRVVASLRWFSRGLPVLGHDRSRRARGPIDVVA